MIPCLVNPDAFVGMIMEQIWIEFILLKVQIRNKN